MADKKSLLESLEEKLGLPALSKVANTLDKFPDRAQLTLIKEVLEIADRLSKSTIELEKVTMLLKEVNSISPEKLVELEKVLKRIEGIMKKAPNELLEFLSSLK